MLQTVCYVSVGVPAKGEEGVMATLVLLNAKNSPEARENGRLLLCSQLVAMIHEVIGIHVDIHTYFLHVRLIRFERVFALRTCSCN